MHYNKFDMVRGVASITVLAGHVMQVFIYRVIGTEHPAAITASILGRHAVLVFFLISGHLITQSIIANIRRNSRFDAAEYLVSRIARIYPPLIGAIVIVICLFAVIHGLNLPGSEHYGIAGDLYTVREKYAVTVKDVWQLSP